MAKAQRQDPETRYDNSLCAGHLLVWTWRKFVIGHADCPLLAREYLDFAGARAEDLLSAFAAFLQALGSGSRRTLAVGHPHSAGLTPDEQQILRLIAATQAGDDALLAAHLRWMVAAEHQAAVLAAAGILVNHLTACGVTLPEAAIPQPPAHPLLEVVKATSAAQAS